MGIFKKLKERFQQKAFLDEFMDDLQNLDEVLLEKRLEIFEEKVSPEFYKIGLINWDGKYKWFSDFNNEGIKHVVEYNVFKSFGGSFSYGNCFISVPTISGKKLVNHKTDKSTTIHFSKRLDGWQKSIEENYRNPDKVSTINEAKFRSTLNDVLTRNIPKLKGWFEQNSSLEQNIASLTIEVKNPTYDFGQRIVSCEYILSFLYNQMQQQDIAEHWINKHFEKGLNSDNEKRLITNKLFST